MRRFDSACRVQRTATSLTVLFISLGFSSADVQAQLGVTLSEPAALNSNADSDSGDDTFPQITNDGDGHWVAVWQARNVGFGTDYDIFVSRSDDGGKTWSDAAALNNNASTDSGGDIRPQITTDGLGNWLAVWQSSNTLGLPGLGGDFNILIAISTNEGLSWSNAAVLNGNASTDTENDEFVQLVTDKLGNWIAVWQSSDTDVHVSRSTDVGANWTPPAPVAVNAGFDRRPQIATDCLGHWVIVWHSDDSLSGTIGNDWDILVSRSNDNGASWTAAAPLNNDADSDDEPGDGDTDDDPQITADGQGRWVAVWFSKKELGSNENDGDILTAVSDDDGATWSDPALLNSNADSDGGVDDDPQITTDGLGNWIAVWQSQGSHGADFDVMAARSSNGTSWTDPEPLNTNADSDSGADGFAQLATDGDGQWVAVWFTMENLGGDIGTEGDILTARFAIPDCNTNSTADMADISTGFSEDCDSNDVPDECQPDTDNDNTIDACDGCPNDPDKTAPGVCGCGTPDGDSDGDLALDCLDGCPNDPNKILPGICGCGEPDIDTDNDMVLDCLDGCPNDQNKTDPGDCGCGQLETDSDTDGTPDCVDGCPNDANKAAPGDCGCGEPETDNDGDGTADCVDGCPNDPNKEAPGSCGCGNPDTDSDNDSFANCIDDCPNDGDSDNDGVDDCQDGCPSDAGKLDEGVCGCGEPDVDENSNGVIDCEEDPTTGQQNPCCGGTTAATMVPLMMWLMSMRRQIRRRSHERQ